MGIGALLYTLLQVAMIGGLDPADIADNWDHPLGQDPSDYGAWYTLALAVGATWLAVILIIDAVISPVGHGHRLPRYVGPALLCAGRGARAAQCAVHAPTRRGVPVVSILVALVVGLIGFGPFKSWAALVSAVTGATAVMYAIAPVALGALHISDDDRPRGYRMPLPRVILPLAFVSANLILYWGGYNVNLKVIGAILVGLVVFTLGALIKRTHAFALVQELVVDPGLARRRAT